MSGTGTAGRITLGAVVLLVLGVAADAAGLLSFMGFPGLGLYDRVVPHHSASPATAPAVTPARAGPASATPKKSPKTHRPATVTATETAEEPPTESAPRSVAPPALRYLADLTPVQSSGDTMEFGSADIMKDTYRHSVALCADGVFGANRCANNGSPTWVEYSVASGYVKLSGTVGLSAGAPSDCKLSVQVLGDGDYLFDHDVALNETYPVTYPVGSVNRIRLQMHALAGHGRCDLIFGNMRLGRG